VLERIDSVLLNEHAAQYASLLTPYRMRFADLND